MRDATCVVFALAMCMLILTFSKYEKKEETLSLVDLKEFRYLPAHLKRAIRQNIPNPYILRRGWARITSDQQQEILSQIQRLVYPNGVPKKPEPVPPPPPAPLKFDPLKKGFLLDAVKKGKKKDPKNKEHDKVVTLGAVGSNVSPENSGPAPLNGFLGSEE